jgi:hypothetical protein
MARAPRMDARLHLLVAWIEMDTDADDELITPKPPPARPRQALSRGVSRHISIEKDPLKTIRRPIKRVE